MPIQAVIQAVYTGYTGCLYRLSIQAIQVVYTGYTGYTGGCIISHMIAPRASIQAIQPGLWGGPCEKGSESGLSTGHTYRGSFQENNFHARQNAIKIKTGHPINGLSKILNLTAGRPPRPAAGRAGPDELNY